MAKTRILGGENLTWFSLAIKNPGPIVSSAPPELARRAFDNRPDGQ